MEPTLVDFWSNTGASAAAGAAGISLGGYVWSLLLVFGLLLFVAWGAKRLLRLPAAGQQGELRLLLQGRLGGGRTLLLWAEGEKVFCAVHQGRQVEFACPVPEVKATSPAAVRAGDWFRLWRGKRGGA